MASVFTRQPFGVLDTTRLQSLSSTKNRQNAITASLGLKEKSTLSTPVKRRAAATEFDLDNDSENVDPAASKMSNKLRKGMDGTPKQPSKFQLNTVPSSAKPTVPSFTRPSAASTPVAIPPRNAMSNPPTLSKLSTATTSISTSRGSPKHKRVKMLSKRRSGSSPFHGINPPSFSRTGGSVPFSLDAALSGTISSYTPKAVPTLDESMPKSWFFDIHVDTAEEEATNLMEHSACVLDISSDDDCDTKRRNDLLERGKENIPPPDFLATLANGASAADLATDGGYQDVAAMKKARRYMHITEDAMDRDRSPLGDLPAADYFPAGLDADSVENVDAPAEKQDPPPPPEVPSSLTSEHADFDFLVPPPKREEEPVTPVTPTPVDTDDKAEITIFEDESAQVICAEAEVAAEVVAEEQSKDVTVLEDIVEPEQIPLPEGDDDVIL